MACGGPKQINESNFLETKFWTWEEVVAAVRLGKAKEVPAQTRREVAAARLGICVGAIEGDEARLAGESDKGRRDKIQMSLNKWLEDREFFTDMLKTANDELARSPGATPAATPAPTVASAATAAGET